MTSFQIFVPIISLVSILYSLILYFQIKKVSPGTEEMQRIAKAIREGADAFLKREFKTMIFVLLILAIFLWAINKKSLLYPIVFLSGALISFLAGFLGMKVATLANVRTTQSSRDSFSLAFKVAFSSGKMMGFLVVGLGLLGTTLIWFLTKNSEALISFAFGCSLVALFMRVGGGIFTKSADIGADLVGKVEMGIPEDDPRNPAVIADQVGDNVGDIAGMGSDLFESYVDAIVSSGIIGLVLFQEKGILLPLIIAGLGILGSLIGSFFAKVSQKAEKASFEEQVKEVEKALNKGNLVSILLVLILSALFFYYFLRENFNLYWCLVIGILIGFLVGKTSEYFTGGDKTPVKNIAKSAQSGASVLLLEGGASAIQSTVLPVLGVVLATIFTFKLGNLYGVALAGLGMLSTLGMNLSTDCYGPIADNAAGIAELSKLPPEIREKTEALDAVGNTTAAIGKGFAIGSAALVALAWLAAFFQKINIKSANIGNPYVLGGMFLGTLSGFLLPSFLIRAVGKGALVTVEEVRRQFREIEGLKEGKASPHYERCVDIVTKNALKEMLVPGILIIILPIIIGKFLGVESLGGFLAANLLVGFPLALIMANGGGAWDNAKKYIEAGNFGGKGSPAHKAAVIGDTVGDPLKDTAGPSINILIKLIGKAALLFLPLFL